jgi:hypothetical protein
MVSEYLNISTMSLNHYLLEMILMNDLSKLEKLGIMAGVALEIATVCLLMKCDENYERRKLSSYSKTNPCEYIENPSTAADTVFLENFVGDYDIEFIRYNSCSSTGYATLNIGVYEERLGYDGKPYRSYDANWDIIPAVDLNNDGTIDSWPYYPGWDSSKRGELKVYLNQEKLSELEKKMLSEIK